MSLENPETWWLALRSIALFCAFIAFAWALLASRRSTAAGVAQLTALHAQALAEIQRLSTEVQEIHSQVRELSLPSPVTSQRLAAVPVPAMAPPPPAAPSPPVRGYEMAIRMARGGATVEDIVSNCGTTRAEARLLRRLHHADGADGADAA